VLFTNYIIIIFGIIFIFILLTILNSQKDKKDFNFIICSEIFNNLINNYIEIIFIPKLNNLKALYNLDKESKLNSIKSFNQEAEKLVSDCVKDFINTFISKKCLKNLLKYYNIAGLSIIIAMQLKKVI
jgi:hypothetical protein